MFLIKNHRFSENRAYGKLVERFSNGTVTKEDIDLINTRLLHDSRSIVLGTITCPMRRYLRTTYLLLQNIIRHIILKSLEYLK